MDKKKKIISLIAGILVAAMAFGFLASIVPVFASAEGKKSSGEIKSEMQDLKEEKKKIDEKIDELKGQISDNNNEMEGMVAQKNILEQEIFLLMEQINNINDQITTYSALIADKQQELVEAQTRLAELNANNKERIRAMEEDGAVSYWSVLFKANSFSDLLDRLNMIEEIAASDHRRLKEMDQAAKDVETAKLGLEEEKKGLEATREELTKSQAELDEKLAEADKLLNKLLAIGAEYEGLLLDAQAQTEEMMAELNQKEKEYQKAKDREYQEWLEAHPPKPPAPTPKPENGGGSAGTPTENDGITWLMPINYSMVSSPYGWRIHPIYGTPRLHAGIDLAAPQGTPIYASRSGVVSIAGYQAGGAGWWVSINHMDGYSTRYMHMTHFIVSEGQKVSAGEVIGYCGSTGASTGPHLHFGVYYNGSPMNPADIMNF